jgi:hypothetical protein
MELRLWSYVPITTLIHHKFNQQQLKLCVAIEFLAENKKEGRQGLLFWV